MFGRRKETPRQRQEEEPRRETERPKPEQGRDIESEEKKQEREFTRAAARLEMSIEDTANALSGSGGEVDPLIRGKIIDALVDNIRDIPQEKRQKLLESVRDNIDARVKEANERQMRPEEIQGRQANAELMKEVDSRLFIELPESNENVIELTEVVDDDDIELDLDR